MKNVKKIIVVLMSIIIVLIILLLLLQNKKENNELNEKNTTVEDNIQLNISSVKDESEYYTIKGAINQYCSYINYLNYNLNLTTLDDNQMQELKKQYFEKGKIALKNILLEDYTKDSDWENKLLKYSNQTVNIDEMNKFYYNNIIAYIVTVNYAENTDNIIVIIDNVNNTYLVLPSEYFNYKVSKDNIQSDLQKLNINKIEKNDNNELKKVNLTDEQICIQYYYDLKDMLKNYQEKLYNKLDKEYREKRFGSLEVFKQYIESNNESLNNIILSKYQVNRKDDYTQYVCLDEKDNCYIFNVTAPMQYTLFLDTYTIDLPEFTEKYNKANEQEKVALNINKIITAINAKDYKYVYNKLADSFKNNYFKNEEELKQYLENNIFEKNKVSYEEFERHGNIYTYKIYLSNIGESKNADLTRINLNIVMQLNEGTDFVMSFSIEE